MAKEKKYYVVWKGRKPGIYDNWNVCKEQVFNEQNARYKAFSSLEEAKVAYASPPTPQKSQPKTPKTNIYPSTDAPIKDSISVDAACSGNPGKMEYRGVYVKDGRELFHYAHERGTNNIGEFLALVHGISYLKKHGISLPLYTDSVNAMKWVQQKKCKTKLDRTPQTETLFLYIERAEKWLQEHTWDTPILKWKTDVWGEIPADFGRK